MPQIADDQTRALLDAMNGAPGPKLYELPVPAAREALNAASGPMDIERCEVARVEDVTVTYDEASFTVRIYSPPGQTDDLVPALIFYHGGAFMLCNIDSHDNIARYICALSGRKVFSVDYRLAPEHPFPAGLHDCVQATEWVFENAADLGIDTAKISLGGDSAGANLCAGVVQMSRRNFYSMVLLYPCCDMSLEASYTSRDLYGGGDYFLGLKDLKWIEKLYAPDEDPKTNSLLSPLHCKDFSDWPSTLVITAGMDILRDEGQALYQRLIAAGVKSDYISYEGTIHGFVAFAGGIDKGRQCLDHICQYLTDE